MIILPNYWTDNNLHELTRKMLLKVTIEEAVSDSSAWNVIFSAFNVERLAVTVWRRTQVPQKLLVIARLEVATMVLKEIRQAIVELKKIIWKISYFLFSQ